MKKYLWLVVCLGCQAAGSDGAPRIDSKQTKVPSALTGDVKYPGSCTSPGRALPTIHMMADLTSAIGTAPLIVSVYNSGDKVDESALSALASQVQILGPDGVEVPSTKTIKNTTGRLYGESGYRITPPATIEVVPAAPLKDEWHTLKVRSAPAGLAWPRFSNTRELADGSRISRFAPGSHPTPSAVRLCEKEGGRSALIVDWSEKVSYPTDGSSLAQAQEISGVPADCLPGATAGNSVTSSMSFMCNKLPAAGAVMALGLHRAISSLTGARLQMAGATLADRFMTRIKVDEMTTWSDGCRIARPW